MIIYAKNEYGIEVHISQVEKGKACKCFCKNCGKPLIAKKGKIKKHHFTHQKGEKDCGYYDKKQTIKRTYNIKPKREEDYIEKHNYTCTKKIKKTSLKTLWEEFKQPFIVEDHFKYILVKHKAIEYGKIKLYGISIQKEWVKIYDTKIFNKKSMKELYDIEGNYYNFIEFYKE